jgi:EAL domain-containing protein (putative c-di-GMP-specific phosphodiesterase class I)
MSFASTFAAVDDYLGHPPGAALVQGDNGSVHAQFFACRLASEFQPIYALGRGAGSLPVAHAGLARGVAPSDQGLSVWRMLDGAASDQESIALDRLCRILHAVNYFRQGAAARHADLYLGVHDRLLAAVTSNHGDAYLGILTELGLPAAQIVLQLPLIGAASRWRAHFVADNYRRNGFRLAFAAARINDAIDVVKTFQPHAVTLDARALTHPDALARLLALARDVGVRVIVKRVDTAGALALLEQACRTTGALVHARGDVLGAPQPVLQARHWHGMDQAAMA